MSTLPFDQHDPNLVWPTIKSKTQSHGYFGKTITINDIHAEHEYRS
jgi:hypothetical protein